MFTQVKNKLIETFGASAESRLRSLIKGQVSTIGKPSLILNRLRGLNMGASDDVIRSVFLDQLHSQCRATLAISELTDLHKLALMADKIVEATDPNQVQISAVTRQESNSAASFATQLTQIMNRLAKLEGAQKNARGRNRSTSRRGRSQSKSQSGAPNLTSILIITQTLTSVVYIVSTARRHVIVTSRARGILPPIRKTRATSPRGDRGRRSDTFKTSPHSRH